MLLFLNGIVILNIFVGLKYELIRFGLLFEKYLKIIQKMFVMLKISMKK